MKKLLSAFTLLVLLIATSCGKNEGETKKETYNKAETEQLIAAYDNNSGTLTHEQYSRLIKNTSLIFAELKETMKDLLGITEPLRFTQEYQKLKADTAFMDKLVLREQAWRVLVLGQKGFSEDNLEEFGNLPQECMLIDYYDDCIRVRLTETDAELPLD